MPPEMETSALSLKAARIHICICKDGVLRHHRDLDCLAISIDLQKSIVSSKIITPCPCPSRIPVHSQALENPQKWISNSENPDPSIVLITLPAKAEHSLSSHLRPPHKNSKTCIRPLIVSPNQTDETAKVETLFSPIP